MTASADGVGFGLLTDVVDVAVATLALDAILCGFITLMGFMGDFPTKLGSWQIANSSDLRNPGLVGLVTDNADRGLAAHVLGRMASRGVARLVILAASHRLDVESLDAVTLLTVFDSDAPPLMYLVTETYELSCGSGLSFCFFILSEAVATTADSNGGDGR